MGFENPENQIEKSPVIENMPIETTYDLREYIDKIGSQNFLFTRFFVDSQTYNANKEIQNRRLELGLQTGPIIPDSIRKIFSDVYQKLVENGFNGNENKILIRWINCNNKDIESIVDKSKEDGGKIDELKGLNMSPIGSKADDVFANNIRNGNGGILFIYDGSKLRPLSEQESKSHSLLLAGYGYKPIDGETYKTSLLGMICIPANTP